MFFERFFEPGLAQVSYLIGCERAHEAIVIDPHRDVDIYLRAAGEQGARITHVTETHIHADFISGARELASRTGATVHVSDADATFRYAFRDEPGIARLVGGDRLEIGRVRLDVRHTPGHTPEHLSFLVTDTASATAPMGMLTGDFLFVGDVGRPDLLETAVGVAGTREPSARALYASLGALADLPDWLQIWPGHGAGSACGKGISALPQSTLGYERRFNWAFRGQDEATFVRQVLEGQPEAPRYFGVMKRVNQQGPRVLGALPVPARGPHLAIENGSRHPVVVDARSTSAFGAGHARGTINLPFGETFVNWAGALLPYDRDLAIIVEGTGERAQHVATLAARALALIGLDRLTGFFDEDSLDAWASSGQGLQVTPQIGAHDLAESLKHGGVTLVDVRTEAEYSAAHIPGARQIALPHLVEALASLPRQRPLVMQCQSGGRAGIAASLLQAQGVDRVINFSGGIVEWTRAGLPVERAS